MTESGVCPICRGAGWVRVEVPVGHPQFGRAVRCGCQGRDGKLRDLAAALERSGLSAEQAERLNFATFLPGVPGAGRAYQAARHFAAQPEGWLLLHGSYGCGKTHLLSAITLHLVRQGVAAHYQPVPLLLDRIRASFDDAADESFARRWERLLGVEVLLLDDLGAEYPTPWVMERMLTLLDHRYRARKPLVAASNAAPEQLAGAIGSRLLDRHLTTVVGISAGDYRRGA